MELTLDELKEALKSIQSLMANPYCDHLMFMDLLDRQDKVLKKIESYETN